MKKPRRFRSLGLCAGILVMIFPMVAFAQYYNSSISFGDVVSFFIDLIERSIVILISVSVIVFVWGVFKYVIAEGEDKQKGKNVMFYGIIGLFAMVSVWGLVLLVTNTLGLDNSSNSLYYYGGSGYGSGGGVGNDSTGGGGFGDTDTYDYGGDYYSPFDPPNAELFPEDLSLPDIDISIE